ncbi:hypothetical protein C9P02_07530 [Salmonella enterica subsp. enterica serovar Enteritidis]|nr:hypothetical protein [Salmonella enterica subsp. enterica serovar Enteritidis]
MATVVKKKRLHELPEFTGDKTGGVVLFSKDGIEYKIPLSDASAESSFTVIFSDGNEKKCILGSETSFYIAGNEEPSVYQVTCPEATIRQYGGLNYTLFIEDPRQLGQIITLTVSANGITKTYEIEVVSNVVDAPTWISPYYGSSSASDLDFILNSFAARPFQTTPHRATSWEVSENEDFSTTVYQLLESQDAKKFLTLPPGTLVGNKTYYARAKFHSDTVNSDWSVTMFSVIETTIQKPTIVSPTPTDVNGPSGLTIETSTFETSGTETHIATDWKLYYNYGDTLDFSPSSNLPFSSLFDMRNLTTITLPDNVLQYGSSYWLRVRYRGEDTVGQWSDPYRIKISRNVYPSNEFQSLNVSSENNYSLGAELDCSSDANVLITTPLAKRSTTISIYRKDFPGYRHDASILMDLTFDTGENAETDGRCPVSINKSGDLFVVGIPSAITGETTKGAVLVYDNGADMPWGKVTPTAITNLPATGVNGKLVKLTPDGETLFVGNGTREIAVYQKSDGFSNYETLTFDFDDSGALCGSYDSIAMTADGTSVAFSEHNGKSVHIVTKGSEGLYVETAKLDIPGLAEASTLKVAASSNFSVILVSVLETHKYYIFEKRADGWVVTRELDYTEIDYSVTSTRYPNGNVCVSPDGACLIFGMVGSLGSMFVKSDGKYMRYSAYYGNTISNPAGLTLYCSAAFSNTGILFVGQDVDSDSYRYSYPQIKIYQ